MLLFLLFEGENPDYLYFVFNHQIFSLGYYWNFGHSKEDKYFSLRLRENKKRKATLGLRKRRQNFCFSLKYFCYVGN